MDDIKEKRPIFPAPPACSASRLGLEGNLAQVRNSGQETADNADNTVKKYAKCKKLPKSFQKKLGNLKSINDGSGFPTALLRYPFAARKMRANTKVNLINDLNI